MRKRMKGRIGWILGGILMLLLVSPVFGANKAAKSKASFTGIEMGKPQGDEAWSRNSYALEWKLPKKTKLTSPVRAYAKVLVPKKLFSAGGNLGITAEYFLFTMDSKGEYVYQGFLGKREWIFLSMHDGKVSYWRYDETTRENEAQTKYAQVKEYRSYFWVSLKGIRSQTGYTKPGVDTLTPLQLNKKYYVYARLIFHGDFPESRTSALLVDEFTVKAATKQKNTLNKKADQICFFYSLKSPGNFLKVSYVKTPTS